MNVVKSLVPFAHVKSVGRSVAFYQQLGFSLVNELVPEGAAEPTWAYLEAGEAQLMVGLAGEPVIPEQQAVLFYLYVDDVAAVHAQWTGEGLSAGPISYPFYCPKGEFRLVDPDGYCLMIAHT
jgi:predicted enzyme related to lactoylglutathione lyase